MRRSTVKFSNYNNKDYQPGKNLLIRFLWMLTSKLWVNSWFPFSAVKIFCLKLFGAKIGSGVVIKPCVNIKYPWKLNVGNFVWIGEGVWIDNLSDVTISDNVCISQGAYLLCGNHNYKSQTFDLIVESVTLHQGVWVGAMSVICPGSRLMSHSVVTAGSVFSGVAEEYSVYTGNPAVKIRTREIV